MPWSLQDGAHLSVYEPSSQHAVACVCTLSAHTRSPLLCCGMQMGFFDDKVGPITVAVVVMVSLFAILVVTVRDVMGW